jgi:transposase InsO family protein
MGWKEVTIMSERIEFVTLALKEAAVFSELCGRFGISRKTGYKFVKRYEEEGIRGLEDRSRRPKSSPRATAAHMERMILDLRDEHPAWGGRKLKRRAEDIGYEGVPSPSTITEILKRNGRVSPEEGEKHKAWRRFEAERPNDLWQMDFKGDFPIREGRCYPLTILDDHSRYSLCIGACGNERMETVEGHLREVFRRYGLPRAMLTDNGSAWGRDSVHRHTSLTVWLMCRGVGVLHSRVRHPQTLGKDERFHRTMKAEVVHECRDREMSECQRLFDRWRMIYNTERPHEALGMRVPAECYSVSEREFLERVREWEYSPSDVVRKVQDGGILHYKGKEWRVGNAFRGQPVGIRPTGEDGKLKVFFRNFKIAHIDLV